MALPEELARVGQGPKSAAEAIWFDRYSHANLQTWRYVQDDLADRCVAGLGRMRPTGMLEEVERRAQAEGGVYREFLDHCYTVPRWVNFDLMEPGRRTYVRYAPLQGLVLMCSSLVEGYAHNKPSQVLVRTGRLQKDVSRRIYETGQMLHNIQGPEGLRPGGIGHRTLMEVRLLHAAVRHFLKDPARWDVATLDLPINQEDMAGTVLEFDFMVVRGMKRLGLRVTREEHESMHYFWRYAGYLLGVKEELLSTTLEEQEVLALQLTTHLYDPTPDGEALAKALLRDMANQPPFNVPENVLLAFSRYLVGDQLANDFHLESTVPAEVAVRAVKAAVAASSRAHRMLPEFALRRMERWSRDMGRKTLAAGLGEDPARWGFKSLA